MKKGDIPDPGNCLRITLLSTVGKTLCKICIDRMGTMLEMDDDTSEGQAGFRPNRSCVDHAYTLGKIFQGRKGAGPTTFCFFLDVQKAYDAVCRNGFYGNTLYRMKIHPSCEIEYFVETHLCKLCVILRSRVLRVVCPY